MNIAAVKPEKGWTFRPLFQRAMATAMIYPDADKRGRGNKGKASVTDGFSSTRLKIGPRRPRPLAADSQSRCSPTYLSVRR
jgi:hypothetical protein